MKTLAPRFRSRSTLTPLRQQLIILKVPGSNVCTVPIVMLWMPSATGCASSMQLVGAVRLDRECERCLERSVRDDDDNFPINKPAERQPTGNGRPCHTDCTVCGELGSPLNVRNVRNDHSYRMTSTMLTSADGLTASGGRRRLPTLIELGRQTWYSFLRNVWRDKSMNAPIRTESYLFSARVQFSGNVDVLQFVILRTTASLLE